MNLKNYTSETPKERSIGRIISKLVEIGAKNINQEFDQNKTLSGIKFLIDINGNTVVFALPAKVNAVFEVLWKEVKRPRNDTKVKILAQAERTAWKIIADWVDIQASMILLEQAEVLQVFLPYALIGNGKITVYETIKKQGFKMISAG